MTTSVLPWSAEFPDLKTIKNLWETVNLKINRENYKTKEYLFEAAKIISWEAISPEIINNLISSVPKRCTSCVCHPE